MHKLESDNPIPYSAAIYKTN